MDTAPQPGIDARARSLFAMRRANLSRRDPRRAAVMRFAGAEARFCRAEARRERDRATREARAREQAAATRASLIATIDPADRKARIERIGEELALLSYRPFGIDIGKRERALRDELSALAGATDRRAGS